jgi:hypothetical protein
MYKKLCILAIIFFGYTRCMEQEISSEKLVQRLFDLKYPSTTGSKEVNECYEKRDEYINDLKNDPLFFQATTVLPNHAQDFIQESLLMQAVLTGRHEGKNGSRMLWNRDLNLCFYRNLFEVVSFSDEIEKEKESGYLENLMEAKRGPLQSIAFAVLSDDGKKFALATYKGLIKLYDLSEGITKITSEQMSTVETYENIQHMLFTSRSDKLIAISLDGHIMCFTLLPLKSQTSGFFLKRSINKVIATSYDDKRNRDRLVCYCDDKYTAQDRHIRIFLITKDGIKLGKTHSLADRTRAWGVIDNRNLLISDDQSQISIIDMNKNEMGCSTKIDGSIEEVVLSPDKKKCVVTVIHKPFIKDKDMWIFSISEGCKHLVAIRKGFATTCKLDSALFSSGGELVIMGLSSDELRTITERWKIDFSDLSPAQRLLLWCAQLQKDMRSVSSLPEHLKKVYTSFTDTQKKQLKNIFTS